LAHPDAVPQSLAKILVHLVFSTKDRRPLLRDRMLREEMHRYLGGNHVHLLYALSRTCEAAEMVKEVKRASSLWVKTRSHDLQEFA